MLELVRQHVDMGLGEFLGWLSAYFRPESNWSRPARNSWNFGVIGCAVVLAGALMSLGVARPVASGINGNLAYGFARIDPMIVYQEIRGRYSYCGYDWDRRCQLRDPQAQQPAVDQWLAAHPPGAAAAIPPTRADVTFIETQGAQSLIVDDLRIANMEYFLGLFDVAHHVAAQIAAGGIATLAAFIISVVLGFATFGSARMRQINPLWAYLAFIATGVFAWVGVHVLAEPPAFESLAVAEAVILLALPVWGLVRLRKFLTRRETKSAFWSSTAAARRRASRSTPAA